MIFPSQLCSHDPLSYVRFVLNLASPLPYFPCFPSLDSGSLISIPFLLVLCIYFDPLSQLPELSKIKIKFLIIPICYLPFKFPFSLGNIQQSFLDWMLKHVWESTCCVLPYVTESCKILKQCSFSHRLFAFHI